MVIYENVSKIYEEPYCEAVKDFSSHIKQGEFVALTGKSGSGKTTLLSMILKEITPSSGRIIVDGTDLDSISKVKLPKYRCQIGSIFQDFRLIEDIDAYENVRLAYMLNGGRSKDESRRVSSIFSMLGIDALHKRLPRQMSGGEQQKVCMARAIVNQPGLLIADEPTGNLDPKSSEEIFSLLKLINMQRITVIMATHDLDAVKRLGCREINLDK